MTTFAFSRKESSMWWKPVGVVGLWLILIAVPHLATSSGVQVAATGAPVPATAPATASPGDPPVDSAARDAGATHQAMNAVITIRFKNALDNKLLTLLQASLALDGEPLAPVTELAPQSQTIVFSGHVAPGTHTVSTHLTCQGKRRGPFTYLQNYRFHVHSEQTVTALENRAAIFTISAVRHKGVNREPDALVDVTIYNELLPTPISEARDRASH
jgi:hypothetical protein